MNNFIKERIPDYLSSEYYMFLDPIMKEYAESILYFFADNTETSFNHNAIKQALNKAAHLELPLSIKKGIPHLLEEFFSYFSSIGVLSASENIRESISLISPSYLASFREDGSVKGETFIKKYSDTGRNDPCPCGSGKKFKKCCMKLIS